MMSFFIEICEHAANQFPGGCSEFLNLIRAHDHESQRSRDLFVRKLEFGRKGKLVN